jgi:ribosomal protein S18 acetylase RimI-like enzyme
LEAEVTDSIATTAEGLSIRPARRATEQDVPDLAQTLAAAFFDDPVFAWVYTDAARRREILPRWFEIVIERILPHNEIMTTDSVVAGAIWVPPGVEVDERVWTALEELSEDYAPRLGECLELMDKHHPNDPHHYLFLVGTRPGWQCRGLGSAVMRPVLEMCDRDTIPAYLEATSENNKRLYLRNGFEVVGEIALPDGPSLWPMWRAPK